MNTQTLTLSGITTYVTSFIPTGTSNLTLPSGNDTLVGQSSLSSYQTVANMTNYAPINNPTFTGTPSAPTATAGTNTTQLATTAFVLANSSGSGTNILPLNNTWTGTQTIKSGQLYLNSSALTSGNQLYFNNGSNNGFTGNSYLLQQIDNAGQNFFRMGRYNVNGANPGNYSDLTINSNGSVGINCVSSNASLQVNGTGDIMRITSPNFTGYIYSNDTGALGCLLYTSPSPRD